MVDLGDEVQNIVTGHKGIVIGISTWLNGCRTVAVKGKMPKDGKVPEPTWYDEIELKVTKKKKLKLSKKVTRDTGGPHPTPMRMLGPSH